ncbi:MAG: phospholipase D-like domain-containing protein [Polyangiaceae bacterium]|nr:phospholipase D-like domain-containing protein [Polyangiaceae bacterium]
MRSSFRRRFFPLTVLALAWPALWAAGCGDSGGGDGNGGGTGGSGGSGNSGGSDAGPDAPSEPPTAWVEIYPLDIWSQLLPKAEAKLTVTLDGQPAFTTGSPVVRVPLVKAGTLEVELSAPEHESLSAKIIYDGSDQKGSAQLAANSEAGRQGLALGHEIKNVDGLTLPVHSLFLGLRHKWFSAGGRPARRGNDISFLMDGEQAWASVAQGLKGAKKSVVIATWWWQSDFELVRDATTHITLTPTDRWKNTILGILETLPAERRVLVGQFWGQDSILSFMTTDAKLKALAEAPGDKFEFMGMANPTKGKFHFVAAPFTFGDRVRASFSETASQAFDTEGAIASALPEKDVDLTQWPVGVNTQIASYHQKFMVIDDELAFIGGMNLKEVDWDTSAHLVFEPRRMLYKATTADRQAVKNKEKLPDQGPRKDYMVRIDGPAAQDAADIFQKRWEHQLKNGADYALNSTNFSVKRDIAERPNGKQIQVTPTLPQPFWEHAIAETWLNAVGQANDYIYIEDQYFRAPMLNDAIVARMEKVPNLKLVVITKPVNEWTDPGCAWTYKSHALMKSKFAARYRLLQLRGFDTVVTWGVDETEVRWADFDVHSKMLIVDDKFLSVGSANKNNRGMIYEGEMNVAVLDPAWVRDARRKIFANFLPAGTAPTDDVAAWWGQLEQAAAANDAVAAAWTAEGGDLNLNGAPLPAKYTPKGFVHSMDFGPESDCLIESVGPDMTVQ